MEKTYTDYQPHESKKLKALLTANTDALDVKLNVIAAADKFNLAMKLLQNADQRFLADKYENIRQEVEALFFELTNEQMATTNSTNDLTK